MRCPKCNYISFDEVEICGGCKKNIAKYSQALHGVIFKAECPDFLWFQKPEEEPEEEETELLEEDAESESTEAEGDDTEIDMGFGDDESEGPAADDTVEFTPDAEDTDLGLDLDTADTATDEEPQEIEFDLDAASPEVEKEQKEETQEAALDLEDTKESSLFDVDDAEDKGLADLSMDGLDDLDIELDDAEEVAPPSVKLDKTPEKKQPAKKKQAEEAPGLDDLDLSGLMPSAAEEAPDISLDDIGELRLEETETEPSKKAAEGDGADLLSDLSIDGLDLDAPILPPASSAAGKKMRPAAKTGTALDSFDIDLGTLLGEDEKNK
jgi:hypothetical protein